MNPIPSFPMTSRPRLPRFKLMGIAPVIIILLGITAWSSWYTVPSDSVAIVQRFGTFQAEVQPGLHFKIPLGVDVATILPVKRQLKQEFGFYTEGASNVDQFSDNPAA